MKRAKKTLGLLLCLLMIAGMLPASAMAVYVTGPTSYASDGTEQPVKDGGYPTPINPALKGELDASRENAIAKKNAYFESESDRTSGILKTDIAMLGDLPANGVDVLFISDVSGSMNLFPVDETKNSAYTCSCCNGEHYYCFPAKMTRGGEYSHLYINASDTPVYFKLSDFVNAPDIGYSLVGVGWDYMPWSKMFAYLDDTYPDLHWYPDLDEKIIAFVNLWNPTAHHYRLTTDSRGNQQYEQIVRMEAPATQPGTASYYSPDNAYSTLWGCEDRMRIAREWIGTFSERILDYSSHSHIGLVDFAGNYAKPAKQAGSYPNNFTSSLSEVQRFLAATAGYDNTHYHLGLNAAAEFIQQHFNETNGCKHQLFVVFVSDGMPDYGAGDATIRQAEANVKAAIAALQDQVSIMRANTDILATGQGAEIYAAGICVSKEATWPLESDYPRDPNQTAEFWLKQITGDATGKKYENCASVQDFEDFMSGVRDVAADALTAVLTDTVGQEFSIICDTQHPITVTDYYDPTRSILITSWTEKWPDGIQVSANKKTITLDIEQLKTYMHGTSGDLAGMRLDFYTQMSAEALSGGALGTTTSYDTNAGDATLTYLDANNNEKIIRMPSPYVTVPGAGTPDSVDVVLSAQKLLNGSSDASGRFSFQLTDNDGDVVQTKSNSKSTVNFDRLTFSSAGVYTYYLTEKAQGGGFVYDPAVYTVTITVTRGADYQASVAYRKDGVSYTGTPVFANSTVPDIPATDDRSHAGVWILLMLISVLGLAIVGRKQRRLPRR